MIHPPQLLLRRDLVVLRELMHRDGRSGGGSPAPRGPESVACFQGMPGHRTHQDFRTDGRAGTARVRRCLDHVTMIDIDILDIQTDSVTTPKSAGQARFGAVRGRIHDSCDPP